VSTPTDTVPATLGTPDGGRGDPPPATTHSDTRARSRRAGRLLDTGLVCALVVVSVVVDPHRMLTQPLCRDENWVAVSLRAPVDQLFRLTSTTPVLFTALLRVTPHTSPSGLRILPLAFTAGCVVPAWFLGRELDPGHRLTAVVLGATVALAPALLARHDLKQYTAEAFTTLVLAWLLARLERRWSTRRLVALAVVLATSTLLSNASMFLAVAVLAGLAGALALRRSWPRLRLLGVVGLGVVAVDALVFVLVDRPGDTPTLRAYWAGSYVPLHSGLADTFHFLHFQAGAELQAVGLGPSMVAAALIVLGLVVLVRTGFAALALVVPLVAVEQVAAATAHRYPLWNDRTSTWFTVLLAVVAMIGVSGLARVVRSGVRGLDRRWVPVARIASGVLLAVLVVTLATPSTRAMRTAADSTTPLEDVHGQVQTIRAQERPGDVVVANVDAGFGLGVYWLAQPQFPTRLARLDTFRIDYPPADRVVVATTISTAAEVAAVRDAVAMARARPGGRVWVVFSHWHTAEHQTMVTELLRYGTLTTPAGQHGLEPVQLLTLTPSGPPAGP